MSGPGFQLSKLQAGWTDCSFRNIRNTFREKSTIDVFITGLAADYCVKYSAIDACRLGFNTFVIKDSVRGIDLNLGDVERAFEEMKKAGAKIIESSVIMRN